MYVLQDVRGLWQVFHMMKGLPERSAVRYSIRQFQKCTQPFFPSETKRLHIVGVFASADDRTQPYDYDIVRCMPDVSVAYSPRVRGGG